MLHRRHASLVAALLASASVAAAAEYAVLETGYRIRAERHETVDGRVRLHTSGGGVIEMAPEAIVYFESDDYAPPPPPSPVEPPPAPQPLSVAEIIEQIAAEHGLPAELIHSVVAAESAYNPNAVSSKGAVGLMQLMPETAEDLQVRDRTNPSENVKGGTTYLRWLLDRYAGEKDQLLRALAAYNAGPGRVEQYDGLPPFDETRAFVRRVIDRFLLLSTRSAGLRPAAPTSGPAFP